MDRYTNAQYSDPRTLKVKNTFIEFDYEESRLNGLIGTDDPDGDIDFEECAPKWNRLNTEPMPCTSKLLEFSRQNTPAYIETGFSRQNTLEDWRRQNTELFSRQNTLEQNTPKAQVYSHPPGFFQEGPSTEDDSADDGCIPESESESISSGAAPEYTSSPDSQAHKNMYQARAGTFPMPGSSAMGWPTPAASAYGMPPSAHGYTMPMGMGMGGVNTSAAAATFGVKGSSMLQDEWTNVYTVMMRNLPNKVSQQQLLSEINAGGFLNTYDFLYLPIDPDTHANRGYAFINFSIPGMALTFKMQFEGQQFANVQSSKVLSVVPATLQGFEANYAHYSTAHVQYRDPAERPLFLRQPMFTKAQQGRSQNSESLIDMASKNLRTQQASPSKQAKPQAAVKAPARPANAGASKPPAQTGQSYAKFCHNCGGGVQESYKFCRLCGAEVLLV